MKMIGKSVYLIGFGRVLEKIRAVVGSHCCIASADSAARIAAGSVLGFNFQLYFQKHQTLTATDLT